MPRLPLFNVSSKTSMYYHQTTTLGSRSPIRAIALDGAGTTLRDQGMFRKLIPDVFLEHGVTIDPDTAVKPLGMAKKDHFKELLKLPEVQNRWRAIHNNSFCQESALESLMLTYYKITPRYLGSCASFLPKVVNTLRAIKKDFGVKIWLTTGFPRDHLQHVLQMMSSSDWAAYHEIFSDSIAGDEVQKFRPHPACIWSLMNKHKVHDPQSVCVVGDTIQDVQTGVNARAFTVAFIKYSYQLNMEEADIEEMSQKEPKKMDEIYKLVASEMFSENYSPDVLMTDFSKLYDIVARSHRF